MSGIEPSSAMYHSSMCRAIDSKLDSVTRKRSGGSGGCAGLLVLLLLLLPEAAGDEDEEAAEDPEPAEEEDPSYALELAAAAEEEAAFPAAACGEAIQLVANAHVCKRYLRERPEFRCGEVFKCKTVKRGI